VTRSTLVLLLSVTLGLDVGLFTGWAAERLVSDHGAAILIGLAAGTFTFGLLVLIGAVAVAMFELAPPKVLVRFQRQGMDMTLTDEDLRRLTELGGDIRE
jgi:hypothetical protein